MKTVSVILARGGSKGIPNKNLVSLCGKPLISYSINSSIKSSVEETWVCTDSPEISAFSSSLGVKVLTRPPELAMDNTPSEAALLFFAENVQFDILVFIQPTSPLLKSSYINEGIRLVAEGAYDSVFSAYEEHWLPRWSMNNSPFNWDPRKRPRRQEVPSLLVENGAFYVTKKSLLMETGLRYGGKIGHVSMKECESLQIDSFNDLEFAERLVSSL